LAACSRLSNYGAPPIGWHGAGVNRYHQLLAGESGILAKLAAGSPMNQRAEKSYLYGAAIPRRRPAVARIAHARNLPEKA